MRSANMTKTCALLTALCCIVPLGVLGAILFLDAPVWPTSLAGLFVVLLLAWRIFVLLPSPVSEEPRPLGNFFIAGRTTKP